jgi:ABC-type transport system substrate-binding protein
MSGPVMGYAHPDDGPIPPAISWATGAATAPAADPAGARQALDAAGWRLDPVSKVRKKGDQTLSLALAAADLEPYRSVAASIRDQLTAVGVKVQLNLSPQPRLVGEVLEGRAFDMIVTAVDNGPDPDIYVFWHSSQAAAGGFNFSGMPKNVFLDKDLEDGRVSGDLKLRQAAYADALKLIKENAAAAYLYSPDVLIGATNRLRGVRLNPGIETLQRFEYAQEWYVNTRRVRK